MVPRTIFEEARSFHQKGDYARAIAMYEEALRDDPKQADVWQLKAMAEHQAGQLATARESAARAIEAGGETVALLMLEGGVLHDMGNLAEAEQRFARAVAAAPNVAGPRVELGRVHLDQGRTQDALADFQAAVSADPNHVRAWNNLGIALQSLNRLDDALRAFNHALTLNPAYPLAHFNVGRIHSVRADPKHALEHAEAAVRYDPSLVEAWLLIGDLQRGMRQGAKAIAAYESAIRAAPANVKAKNVHAETLAEMGRIEEAKREYREISTRVPDNLRAALGANLLLPQVYSDLRNLETARRGYAAGLERLHEAASGFRFSSRNAALAEAAWTNFYLAYQGQNDRALQARYGDLQRRVLEPVLPEFFEPRARRPGGDRIRVGFLSHFFFNCTAGRYFMSWITHLDKSRFETFVYYTNEWVADDTRTIAAAAGTFRHLPKHPLYTVARHVTGDALDILVYPELGMHPDVFTLAGLRLAPVQASGWGHPTTTGLPEIDWFISCTEMEPTQAQEHYRERLALLPGLGTRYAIPRAEATGSRADFSLPEDKTLYLVPQSLFKIHPDNDDLVARVLERDPRGVAVMFTSPRDQVTADFGVRLHQALARRNLSMEDRVLFLESSLTHENYVRLNELCDVMLDTAHWSGGNTSLDALAAGLPIVTLPGRLMRSRQSQAMLRALGCDELVTSDADGFVAKAVELGTNVDLRRSLSERILANRGELFERDEPVRALEAFLERAVIPA